MDKENFIIPSNPYLNDKEKELYEKFIEKNLPKIKGVFLLLNIKPFGSGVNLDEYYKYMGYVTKKYGIIPIGIFNETSTSKFSKTLKEDILEFQKGFEFFYKSGITTIVRPYNWNNFNFFHYKVRFFIPSDSVSKILKRFVDKRIFFSHLEYLQNGIAKEVLDIKKAPSNYENRLSIAHPDSTFMGDLFYKAFKKIDPQMLSEIDDIYFGKEFIYDDGFKYLKYGNVMGSNASDEQIDYLFKIQDELGVSISLTLNAITPPPDLIYDPKVLEAFLIWLKKFYDRGLRVVTISSVHLIKTGILQKNFPLMRFKNTVNHKIHDTQSFINYANLGYDFIQLDRSLVRNMNELKKIKKANQKYGKKLYLLASEYCMYSCPFKSEHDNVNQEFVSAHPYFDGELKLSHISCDNWRMGAYGVMPRNGVDLIPKDKKAIDEYLSYVDVLKFSGRLMFLDDILEDNLTFLFEGEKSMEKRVSGELKTRLRIWTNRDDKLLKNDIYQSKEGEQLLDFLKTCKNECYDCHLCEKVFGVEPFDSLVELKSGSTF
jgi:hypothetical protein